MIVIIGGFKIKLSYIYFGKENLRNWEELLFMGWSLFILNFIMGKKKLIEKINMFFKMLDSDFLEVWKFKYYDV